MIKIIHRVNSLNQLKNIKDVNLNVFGGNATEWMSIAQCFAGPAETPPAPGTRKTLKV